MLFNNGALSATTLTALWCVVFFFASAGASAAYLAVKAERRSLEDVAKPLTAHDGEHDDRIDLTDRQRAGAMTTSRT